MVSMLIACKLDAIWRLAILSFSKFWKTNQTSYNAIGNGSSNRWLIQILWSNIVPIPNVILLLKKTMSFAWSNNPYIASAVLISVLNVEIWRMNQLAVKKLKSGKKRRNKITPTNSGLRASPKSAPNATLTSRSIMVVTIWHAQAASINSAGFAWVTGVITTKAQEASLTVFYMKKGKTRPALLTTISKRCFKLSSIDTPGIPLNLRFMRNQGKVQKVSKNRLPTKFISSIKKVWRT